MSQTLTASRSLENASKIVSIALSSIEGSPLNGRAHYDPKLDPKHPDLVASIKKYGVIQPVVLHPLPEQPGKFGRFMGQRRTIAAQAAGLKKIPARIISYEEAERLSNVQVAEHTTFKAWDDGCIVAFIRGIVGEGKTPAPARLARELGLTQKTAAGLIQLVKDSASLSQAVENGEVTAEAAVAINENDTLNAIPDKQVEDPETGKQVRLREEAKKAALAEAKNAAPEVKTVTLRHVNASLGKLKQKLAVPAKTRKQSLKTRAQKAEQKVQETEQKHQARKQAREGLLKAFDEAFGKVEGVADALGEANEHTQPLREALGTLAEIRAVLAKPI